MATANNQQKKIHLLSFALPHVRWWEKFIKCRYLKRVPPLILYVLRICELLFASKYICSSDYKNVDLYFQLGL